MTWQFIAITLRDTTPILFAALAGLLAFRVGIFHLGLEGIVCMAAFASVAVTKESGSVVLGVLAAVGAGMALSALFWVFVDLLHGNVIIVGLGITGIGVAGSSYLLQVIFNTQGAIQATSGLYQPVTGHPTGPLSALSGLSILTWTLPVVAWLVWLFVRRSTIGLRLTVVGEYPFAARNAGLSVSTVRLLSLVAGGALCGLGGADLAMGYLDSFTPDLTNGLGYIAFTAVVFGAATPLGVAAASLSFGLANSLGVQAQLQQWSVPTELVMMIPYAFTIVAVTIAARVAKSRGNAQAGFAELRI